MAVKARSKSSKLTFLRLAYSAPAPHESAGEEQVRRFTLPATKALPFVKLRPDDQPMWRPDSFWNVSATGKRTADVQLGRAYARQAIAAMQADHNSDLVGWILQDIIRDNVERAHKTGNTRLSPTVRGFLMEVSEALAAAR